MFYGSDSGWRANVYQVVIPKVESVPEPKPEPKPINVPEGIIPVWDEKPEGKRPRYSKRMQQRMAT
jgi:hypothetical protein